MVLLDQCTNQLLESIHAVLLLETAIVQDFPVA